MAAGGLFISGVIKSEG